MLDLELHPGGQECGPFEQPADHRIEIVVEQSAEALSHSRIFLREFSRLFTKDCEL